MLLTPSHYNGQRLPPRLSQPMARITIMSKFISHAKTKIKKTNR
jgi:hypothetical protein